MPAIETPDPINPTVANLLSPRVRARVYALLALVVPTATLAVELMDPWDWVSNLVVLAASGATFARFGLARSNTPATRP